MHLRKKTKDGTAKSTDFKQCKWLILTANPRKNKRDYTHSIKNDVCV